MSDTIQVIGGEIDIDEARRTVRKFDLPLGSADMLELNTRDMRSSGLTPTLVKNSNEATLEALNLLVAAFTGFRDNLAQAMVALHPYVVPEMHCRDIENATKWNHIVEHISKMNIAIHNRRAARAFVATHDLLGLADASEEEQLRETVNVAS
jgi:hypothetical protein